MKYLSISMLLLLAVISGCQKNDSPTPQGGTMQPFSAFKINNISSNGYVVEGKNLKLENNSKNAVSYSWDFGNGVQSNLKTPNSVYYVPCGGSYTITLTTKNATGETSTCSQAVNVLCSGKGTHGLHLTE